MTYLGKLLADNAVRIGEEGLTLLAEDVVAGSSVADGIAADSSGSAVVVYKLPGSESDRARVMMAALSACAKLDHDRAYFASFCRKSKISPGKGRARVLFLADSAPGAFLSALSGLAAPVKLALMSVVPDLDHPVRFELLYDSTLPEPSLSVTESASNPRHDPDEVLLSPLLARLKATIEAFGPDVTVSVKSRYTGFYRTYNFAVAHDHGDGIEVAFRKTPRVAASPRLRDAADWGWSSVTDYVGIRSAADLDAELVSWLRAAYEES